MQFTVPINLNGVDVLALQDILRVLDPASTIEVDLLDGHLCIATCLSEYEIARSLRRIGQAADPASIRRDPRTGENDSRR